MDIEIFRTLFIIYIMFITGSVTNIMGCKMNKLLKNIYFKHIGLIILIYFSIVLSNDKYDTLENNLINTLKIWLFYIIFVRVNITFNLIVILSFIVLFTLVNYKKYIDKEKNIKIKHYELLEKSIIYLKNIIPIIMIIGFIFYIYHNHNKVKNLSIIKFVLGDFDC